MFVYYLLFALAACAGHRPFRESRQAIIFVSIIMTIAIGVRHEVGGDWSTYLTTFARAQNSSIENWRYVSHDIGYAALNIACHNLGLGLVGVNTIAGAILMTGIAVFSQRFEAPWLVFVSATAYLVIVVGMGYARQSMAVGFELLALTAIMDKKSLRFLIWIAMAGVFHKSAFILLPLGIFAAQNRTQIHYAAVLVSACVGIYVLFSAEAAEYVEHYVESSRYSSTGALVRLAMSAAAGTLLVLFHKQFCDNNSERLLWGVFVVVTLIALGLTQISSTAADRLGIYLIPMQLFVCGRINRLSNNSATPVAAVICYALALTVWLNFAVHADQWVPYQISPSVYQDTPKIQ